MATKNFFLYLVVLSFVVISFLGCDTFPLKTRDSKTHPQKEEKPEPADLQPDIEKPAFLQKEPPKLGLILGGGGALSFAHVGFLQELENHKIPVHAIGGIEWGALVAGAYSLEGKAHAIEWKLLKLPVQKFKNEGLFTSGKSGVKVSSFNGYLDDVFNKASLSEADIPFACPFVLVPREKNYMQVKGRYKKAVRSCWPYPPHFKIDTIGANLNGVADLASFLRKNGAELIVYVDVTSRNKLLKTSDRQKKAAAALSWIENKSLVDLMVRPLVDEVIRISVSGHNINSYKSLRSIIRVGQVKSKTSVKELSKKYAY